MCLTAAYRLVGRMLVAVQTDIGKYYQLVMRSVAFILS